MFPDDINEIYVSDEYDEENVNGGNCESYEEEFWIDVILEKLDSLRLCFASIVMLNTCDTKVINLVLASLFCYDVLHIIQKMQMSGKTFCWP